MPGIFLGCFWFEWSGDVLSLLMKEEKKRREKREEGRVSRKRGMERGVGQAG
jgi:hypothetical protein